MLEAPIAMSHEQTPEAEVKRLTQALDAASDGINYSHTPYDYVGPDNILLHDAANCPRCRYKAARLALHDWIQRQLIEQAQVTRYPFIDLNNRVRTAAITEARRALQKYPRH